MAALKVPCGIVQLTMYFMDRSEIGGQDLPPFPSRACGSPDHLPAVEHAS